MNTFFQSDNIQLCSFLLTQQVKLVEVKEDTAHHFIFVLEDLQKCTELEKDFLNNASAPARELFSQREMLISQIKQVNRNGDQHGFPGR